MDKYKKILILFLLVLTLSILSINALTINLPSDDSTVSGTGVVLNVSAPANEQLRNCSVYAKSSSTANSSWTLLRGNANVYNSSYKDDANGTFDSTIIEDASNYQFNFTCKNQSNAVSDVLSSANIKIDNTIPQTPSSLQPSTYSSLASSNTAFSFSATVTNVNTTNCTYRLARDDTSSGNDYITGSGTYSGSNCSFTKSFSATTDNGNWYWLITAGDEKNTSTSGKNILTVNLAPSGGNLDVANQLQNQINQQTQTQTTQEDNTIYWIIGIIVVVIIGIIIYNRKK